ncbi:hypothetical protein [Mucilaginibacter sp. AK015]|uniref:hypothetical protein n=1 Tax=Mucilaginibacter sp. AK015 TaxID=2723072 RepID=UPI00161B2EFB|nr:hypothetical protein [Mucilaginibacter sp. AK015]MBB5397181.1 hypothetical protein [Mucilaginibacter sp. AK015]
MIKLDIKPIFKSQTFTNWMLVIIGGLNFYFLFNFGSSDNLTTDFGDEMYISQEFGNLHFIQSISVKNIGKKPGFITKIKAFVRTKDSERVIYKNKIEGRRYLDLSVGVEKPLLVIPLAVNEVFNTSINLYNPPGRLEEDSANALNLQLIKDSENGSRGGSIMQAFTPQFARKGTADKIEHFILARLNDFKKGEYEYIIEIFKDDEDEPFVVKAYSFSIYPNDILSLQATIKNFQQMSSINAGKFNRPYVHIRLTEILKPDIIESLKKEVN